MYKISITKVETETYQAKEWKKVADSGNKKDGGAQYDYVSTPGSREIESEVYSQQVSDLDLVSVINAVNTPPKEK